NPVPHRHSDKRSQICQLIESDRVLLTYLLKRCLNGFRPTVGLEILCDSAFDHLVGRSVSEERMRAKRLGHLARNANSQSRRRSHTTMMAYHHSYHQGSH